MSLIYLTFRGFTHSSSIGYGLDNFMQCVCKHISIFLIYLLNGSSIPSNCDDFFSFLLVIVISGGTKDVSMVFVVAPVFRNASIITYCPLIVRFVVFGYKIISRYCK